jgi:UDP-glucose 4-epimerase
MTNKKNKTICITGGAGYVGSRVALELAKRGHAVVVIDIATPVERGIEFPKEIEFRKHDLRIPTEANAALRGADIVLHLAADIGSLTYMHDHQADIIANNSLIDAAAYPAMVANGVGCAIYSSSSGVFQHPPKFPYSEEDIGAIRPPSNVYFFSKLAGEYFASAFAVQHGLPFTILRYHNIYGPGEDTKGSTPGDIHVIPALLEKVLSGQYPLEFLGDPDATRPFVFVDDAVEATVEIVVRAATGDESILYEDFNVGNGTHHSILELGEIIWKKFGDGRPFKYVVAHTDANTAHRREVNIEKIKRHIGWEPQISLEEGLAKTAEWIKRRKSEHGRSLWK